MVLFIKNQLPMKLKIFNVILVPAIKKNKIVPHRRRIINSHGFDVTHFGILDISHGSMAYCNTNKRSTPNKNQKARRNEST